MYGEMSPDLLEQMQRIKAEPVKKGV